MANRNIIFGTKTATAAPKFLSNKPQQQTEKKPRKKRSDAKNDIKFRLSTADKKTLQLAAMDHRMSLTAFASQIIKTEFNRLKEYDFYEYDNQGDFVHVVLEDEFFRIAQRLRVDWGMPLRRVVHRIVMDYIERSKGSGPRIYHYNDRRRQL